MILLTTSAQSPRPAPRLALRPAGRSGRLRRPCLLVSLPLCRRALRLSPLLAWRGVGGGVRRIKKKRAGVFVFPVRLSVLLSDVIYALVVVVQIALLADDIAVRSARADMRVCVAWLKLLAHAGAVRPAFYIQDGVLGILVRCDIDVLGEGFVEGEEYGLAIKAFPVKHVDIVV